MTELIIDSHCHLDYDGLADHLPAVLLRAKEQGCAEGPGQLPEKVSRPRAVGVP